MRNFGALLCFFFVIVTLSLVSAANGRFNYGDRRLHDMVHDQTTREERPVPRRVNKPDACPYNESPFGSCEKTCSGDSDCEGKLKCCSHGPNDCGTQCKESVTEKPCPIPCPKNYDPVCGTDDVTYGNECMLRFTTCTRNQNNFIKMKEDGRCKLGHPCEEELKKYSNPMPGQMVPQCDVSGYYRPMQCWASTGSCWCATRHGNAIETPDDIWISSDEDCLQFLKDTK